MLEADIDRILEQLGRKLAATHAKPADRNAFNVGTSFHLAAKRCAEPVRNPDGTVVTPTSPMICCLAFASELYVKALLHSSNPRGHDLGKLFQRLSSKDRRGIARQYAKLTNRGLPQLRKDIEAMAGAFIMWRYVYENATAKISVHRLAMLARALLEHCISARPDWKVKPANLEQIRAQLPAEVASLIYINGVYVRATPKNPEDKVPSY